MELVSETAADYEFEDLELDVDDPGYEEKRDEIRDEFLDKLYDQLESINSQIEHFLDKIDSQYKTKYSPTGATRIY